MTRTAFVNAKIICPEREEILSGALVIEDDKIIGLRQDVSDADITIDCNGKHLAPGLVDLGVKVSEPGERQKESFATAGQAAAAGGVTTMITRPDTLPPLDSPETLQFVHRRATEDAPVRVHPMASLTKAREGREMAEIGFLQDAGAIAFTDADRPIQNPKLFSRIVNYAAALNALIIAHTQDAEMSDGAAATSGAYATKLGLPGASPVAERMQMQRDLALIEGTGVRFHFDQVSTAAGVDVLRTARARKIPVTSGVSIHHLTLNEFDVGAYRTFFKVKPPLRSEEDRMAVVHAIADGEIDIICSMHTPQDEESKRLPFEEAASGAVGLETLLSAALQLYHSEDVPLPRLIKAMTLNPASLLGLPQGRLSEGAPADLILFDADVPYVLDRATLKSKSKNTPYDLRRMQGLVLKTFVGGDMVYEAGQS